MAHSLAHFQLVKVGKRVWVDKVPDAIVALENFDSIN